MSTLYSLEELLTKLERMQLEMAKLATHHRGLNEDASRHCAGVAEGLSIACVALRHLIKRDYVDGHRLEVVK